MKKLLLLSTAILLFLLRSSAQQQISGGGFETWKMETPPNQSTNPEGWTSYNYCFPGLYCYDFVTRCDTAKAGKSSVKIKTLNIKDTVRSGALFSRKAQPFTGKPVSFNFSYQYFNKGNDTATIGMVLFNKNNDTIGYAYYFIYKNTPFWTDIKLPVIYEKSGPVDSVYIAFISSSNTKASAGAFLLVDEVVFEYDVITGINQDAAADFSAIPNPVDDYLTITGPAEIRSLSVYDFNGSRKAYSEGPEISLQDLSPGIYNVEILSADGPVHKKIVKN